jgi:hypothetical protein
MDHSTHSSLNVDAFSKNIKQLADLSSVSLKNMVENNLKTFNDVTGLIRNMGISIPNFTTKKDDCGCCPPKHQCPPRCILSISRTASAGEKIIVPFKVKNTSYMPKVYQVGVRPLKNENGELAPTQPTLNKNKLELDGSESELVLMAIDLEKFIPGHTFYTDIVLREKDINQNICFHLLVKPYSEIPEAKPVDERKYRMHFQDWKTHYYCESPRKREGISISAVDLKSDQ